MQRRSMQYLQTMAATLPIVLFERDERSMDILLRGGLNLKSINQGNLAQRTKQYQRAAHIIPSISPSIASLTSESVPILLLSAS